MKVVADENVDSEIVRRLRADGFDVIFIAELDPGITDEVVLAKRLDTNSLLITADKDFGGLVYRPNHRHAGVLLVRLEGLPSDRKASLVATVLRVYANQLITSFAVLTATLLRLRMADGAQLRVRGDSL